MRLLSFCALIHALILGALFLNELAAGRVPDLAAYLSGLSYGILALLAFGHLLTWLPKKYSQSPIHYGRYNSIYLLMMTGLGILEAGIFLGNSWPLIGMFLLVPAWLVALQGLRNVHIWINSESQSWSRQLLWLLSVNFVLLILSIAGQHYHCLLYTSDAADDL